jgi:hypothetical protein
LDQKTTETLLGFTLQQGVAFVVMVAVAVIFAYAIVKLFKAHREDLKQLHDDCREERKADRAEWMAAMDKHSDAVRELSADIRRKGAA